MRYSQAGLETKIYMQKGQSLFEVLAALVVVTVIVVAVVSLGSTSIRNVSFARNTELSTRFSQEGIEWLRSERDAGWDVFSARATTASVWCIKSDSPSWPATGGLCAGASDRIPGTVFTREVAFTIIDSANIDASVEVYWTDAQGLHEVRTVTTFSDWRAQ